MKLNKKSNLFVVHLKTLLADQTVLPRGRMEVNTIYESSWKEAVVVYFDEWFQNLTGLSKSR